MNRPCRDRTRRGADRLVTSVERTGAKGPGAGCGGSTVHDDRHPDDPAGDAIADEDPHHRCRHHRGPVLGQAGEAAARAVRRLLVATVPLGGLTRLGFHRYGLCCQSVRVAVTAAEAYAEADPTPLVDLPPGQQRDIELALTAQGWRECRNHGRRWFELAGVLPEDLAAIADAIALAVTAGLRADPSAIEVEALWDPDDGSGHGGVDPASTTDTGRTGDDDPRWIPLDVGLLLLHGPVPGRPAGATWRR